MNIASLALILTLAWRNLWRRPRRTAILLSAVALGAWSMVSLAALSRGAMEQQIRSEIENMTGHIQIHARGYLDDPAVNRSMPPPGPELLGALAGREVEAWAARVSVAAVVSSERDSAGVVLVGIDPSRERGLSFIGKGVAAGKNLAAPEDSGILLGRKLAERLETGLGRRVVVMSQDAKNRIADKGVRVAGVFRAPFAAMETGYIFMGRKAVQDMLKMGEQVSEIALMTRDRHDLGTPLRSVLPAAAGLDVRPWTQLKPLLVLTEKITNGMLYIWFVVIFLAMSFGFVNTLLMAVHERTREIGLLQALGMPPSLQLGQILGESALLLLLGLAAGNAMTWGTLYCLRDGLDLSAFAKGLELVNISPIIRPVVSASDFLGANALVVVLGFLASWIPAWRATRQVPIETLTRC